MAKTRKIFLRGYVKEENRHYGAVCIDLNIVAQGNTPDEATEQCHELIIDYLSYICDEYPDRIEEFVPRLALAELIEEY